MENNELITMMIELGVMIVAFVVGRYILPKYKTNIQHAAAEFQVLLSYAESYVAYAKQFLNVSGEEKMNAVVEKLKVICEKQNIQIDEETLRAIGQKAYDAMKAGEASSKVIIETAVEELKTYIPVEAETLEPVQCENAEQVDPFNDDTK